MVSRMAVEIMVGFRMGNTTLKKIWMGLQPSIMAASSISMGTLFIKPVNMNTARPAPKPM